MLVDWKVKLVLQRCADEADDDRVLKQEPGSRKAGGARNATPER